VAEVGPPACFMPGRKALEFYAHSSEGRPPPQWQPLATHLQAVSELAAQFSAAFDSADWGRLAGLWHDLGKYSRAFQEYLKAVQKGDTSVRRGEVDHATAGARHAARRFAENNPVAGRVLAYCIAGHHGGLADWNTASDGALSRRLLRDKPEILDAMQRAPATLLDAPPPTMPSLIAANLPPEQAFQAGVFIRMLFSCLVDADALDAEKEVDGMRSATREIRAPDMIALEERLTDYLRTLPSEGDVNTHRRQILAACLSAANQPPGLFSLTVPTGGGKSLSSLAFALKHSRLHGLKRIIYAIPFTSIIEQNAERFRKALGDLGPKAILEHHSNFDPRRETLWSRLASENWVAPLVVTTNVQFFESLFASRTSQCRKLHNIAHSVIILDEVQTLPVTLLTAALAMLRELVRNYGCTIVLCTATQPALHCRPDFPIGIEGVREIIADPASLYTAMRRARVECLGPVTNLQLVERLVRQPQALCIVNTKRHAAEVYRLLAEAGPAIHLSASMCPRHRSAVLRTIRRQLEAHKPCRVVSTQLIEAGVDIDFPVVYRAMAGLDSIAQAAGRCNREGGRPMGTTYVFEAERPPPPGYLQHTADTTRELVGLYDDLLSLEAVEHYFSQHFWKRKNDWDRRHVMDCFRLSQVGEPMCDFREAAATFKLIDDDMIGVIIPWGHRGKALVKDLKANPIGDRKSRGVRDRVFQLAERERRRARDRALQRYVVQVPRRQMDRLRSFGFVQPVCEEILEDQYLVLEFPDRYSRDLGLLVDDDGVIDPEKLIM